MLQHIELAQGEIKIVLGPYAKGKMSLKSLGISNKDLVLKDGILKLIFEFATTGNNYFSAPAIELTSKDTIEANFWSCEFNYIDVLDKVTYEEHSATIHLDRDRLMSLESRHYNQLILKAEVSKATRLVANKSHFNFFD